MIPLTRPVPPLFDKELPPCGPEMQVAYERLVNLLRSRWLDSGGHSTVAELVSELEDELADEQRRQPLHSERMTRRRDPWRREIVFLYEIRWCKYFVREAADQELDPYAIDIKPPTVPPELKFKWEITDKKLLKRWREWNARKRPSRDSQECVDRTDGVATDSDVCDEGNSPLSIPVVQESSDSGIMPVMNGSGEAGHEAWSNGGHD